MSVSAVGASVFVLGIKIPINSAEAKGHDAAVLNVFIGLDENGVVTFQNPFIEMGQGTYTSLPVIIAEEMDLDMANIKVVQAPHGKDYKILFNNTIRFTGGSLSVRSSYPILRTAGATARAMLIAAAANKWGVKADECKTEPGFVVHEPSGKKLPYGQLAKLAAKQPVPKDIKLKDSAAFRLIGKPVKRTDALVKATGAAMYGMDTGVKGMLYAAVRHIPEFGGTIASIDKKAALLMPNVLAVEEIPNGIAVIAKDYWHAKKALEALPITFSAVKNGGFSSEAYLKTLKSSFNAASVNAENIGDALAALKTAAKTIEAEYHVPFIAHATMEPANCTALVTRKHCTVWAPNQGADFVAELASKITGLSLDKIEVITPFLGGGFGRRFILDFVGEAVTLANNHKGKAIKVIWSREEDLQHGHYRPMSAAKFRAGFDADGNPLALHVTTVGEGPMGRLMPGFLKDPKLDASIFEGTVEQPYAIPNKRGDVVNISAKPTPICFWRSVGHSQNAFFKESFIDEMAHQGNVDPVEFRRKLLAEKPRFKKVLDTAVKMAGWKPKAWDVNGKKHAFGVALHESFNSIVAEVAEVALDDGILKVVKVWCAVDCGFAVNPAIVKMQMESGICFGLSAAMGEAITIEQGQAKESNFDTYPILRSDQMPAVEVEIINSGEAMGGIGEPGTPPIAPAVCNAIFALTGKRIRSLPLSQYTF